MAGTKKGKQGVSTSGVEHSAAWVKRQRKRREREEASWRARNGPVIVRQLEDDASKG